MIVNFTKEILESDKQKQDLSYLIQTIVKHKHRISFDSNITQLPEWIDQRDRDVLEESFAASVIGNNPNYDCNVVNDASDIALAKVFSLSEAITYVSTPLSVMIENSNNDSLMILKALEVYTSDTCSAYYEGRLCFDHGGGCSAIKGVLSEKLRQNGTRPKMLRYYVIVDGDQRFYQQKVTKYDNLIAFLRANNIPFHILEKRCMENYLPCNAFPDSSTKESQKWLSAFRSLTPRQRDYFNISGGLRGELSDENKKLLDPNCSNIKTLISKELQNFYASVSDKNLQILAYGYPLKSFKEEFPKGFSNASVTRELLDQIQVHQDNPTELKQVAETIMRLL